MPFPGGGWKRCSRSVIDTSSTHTEETEVKKFVMLHYGFETPTPEIMEAWGAWFESIADKTVANDGFAGGREISASGTQELEWGSESITGYTVIEAESLDEAEAIAKDNPFIRSIRVYEIREH
jgi:hypothetical protein